MKVCDTKNRSEISIQEMYNQSICSSYEKNNNFIGYVFLRPRTRIDF